MASSLRKRFNYALTYLLAGAGLVCAIRVLPVSETVQVMVWLMVLGLTVFQVLKQTKNVLPFTSSFNPILGGAATFVMLAASPLLPITYAAWCVIPAFFFFYCNDALSIKIATLLIEDADDLKQIKDVFQLGVAVLALSLGFYVIAILASPSLWSTLFLLLSFGSLMYYRNDIRPLKVFIKECLKRQQPKLSPTNN